MTQDQLALQLNGLDDEPEMEPVTPPPVDPEAGLTGHDRLVAVIERKQRELWERARRARGAE